LVVFRHSGSASVRGAENLFNLCVRVGSMLVLAQRANRSRAGDQYGGCHPPFALDHPCPACRLAPLRTVFDLAQSARTFGVTARRTGQSQESTRHPLSGVSVGRVCPFGPSSPVESRELPRWLRLHPGEGRTLVTRSPRSNPRAVFVGVLGYVSSPPPPVCLSPIVAAAAEVPLVSAATHGGETEKPPSALRRSRRV
jgi:hypothetical protein